WSDGSGTAGAAATPTVTGSSRGPRRRARRMAASSMPMAAVTLTSRPIGDPPSPPSSDGLSGSVDVPPPEKIGAPIQLSCSSAGSSDGTGSAGAGWPDGTTDGSGDAAGASSDPGVGVAGGVTDPAVTGAGVEGVAPGAAGAGAAGAGVGGGVGAVVATASGCTEGRRIDCSPLPVPPVALTV